MSQSQTNETTEKILDFLIDHNITAYRNNTLPVPVTKGGVQVGYRPASKAGRADIEGWMRPRGRALFIEVKTGKDRLSDIQVAHLEKARRDGVLVLVVKDFEDFMSQWELSTAIDLIPET